MPSSCGMLSSAGVPPPPPVASGLNVGFVLVMDVQIFIGPLPSLGLATWVLVNYV